MKVKNLWSVMFIVFALITSCSDDNNGVDEIEQKNSEELLTAHPWKFKSQEINGQTSDFITSGSIPYIAIFNADGTFAMANFYHYEDNLPWTFDKEQIYVDEQLLNIDEISETNLKISYTDEEDGDVTLYFESEEPADAFEGDAIYGKHYKVAEAVFNSETQTMENNLSLYRFRALIEDGMATATSEKAVSLPYTIVSKTFVFVEGMSEGYEMEVDAEGDLHLLSMEYVSSGPKSASVTGTTETESAYTLSFRFTECDLSDFLTGPDWKLTEVEKNGQVTTQDLPIDLGTIWFINPLTQKIEERPTVADDVAEYLLWDFVGTPTADNIQLEVTIDGGEVLTFTVIQISLTELVFETEYNTDTYRFTFSVENEQDV